MPAKVEGGPALQQIVAFANRQLELEDLIVDMTTSMQDLAAQHRQIAEVDLPLAMKEAGLIDFTLDTGEKITVKEDYSVSIRAEDRERAWDWLEEHNFGGLIKTELKVNFGKGELEKALELQLALQKKKMDVGVKRDVPWQTLKKFIKEQVQAITKKTPKKDRIPLSLFGAEPTNKAVIKSPKKKKEGAAEDDE